MSTHRSLICGVLAWGACLAAAQEESPLVRLFDTTGVSAEPLTGDAVAARKGWQLVPEDQIVHAFAGDAAVVNDKLVLVLRQKGCGAEAYAWAGGVLRLRATAGHAPSRTGANDAPGALKIIENGASAVELEVSYASAVTRFRVTTGEGVLELEAEKGFFDVRAARRFAVVPDYFGDDLVFAADTACGARIPAENFCLDLLEGGDAILMTVWQSRAHGVWCAEKGSGLPGSRIDCLPESRVWLAFLEAPGIWRSASAKLDASWQPPFPAKWRASLCREGGSADSWDLDKGPAPEQAARAHAGPLVVYPIDRVRTTPLAIACPTDVMRNTLGVGPCQYILEVEGMAVDGSCTPDSVMEWVEKQFERKKAGAAAKEIGERLDAMLLHVRHARDRLESYGEFSAHAKKMLAGAVDADRLVALLAELDGAVAAGVREPASPKRAFDLMRSVKALTGTTDALAECRRIGAELRAIGELQDGSLARARTTVRRLRYAALDGPPSDDAAEIARCAGLRLERK